MVGLKVAPCSHKAAEYAVLNWHYSERMPAGKIIAFGVWEDDKFIGTVLFGRGSNNNLGRPYGLEATQVCELVRVALREHETPVSQVLALTLKVLRQTNPGLRLVVSFADPAQGHHGGIYQAGNWVYAGTATSAQIYTIHGKQMHERTVGARGWVRNLSWLHKNVDPHASRTLPPPKHRYLMPLDRGMRRQLSALQKPYPSKTAEQASA